MLTLSTDSLKGYGLNRIFKFCAAANYEGIDLNIDLKSYDTTNAEYLNSLSQETKITIRSVSASNFTDKKNVLDAIELTKNVGAKTLIIQPPKVLEFSLSRWLKTEIPKISQKEGIYIAIENAPAGTYLGVIPEYGLTGVRDLKDFRNVALDTSRLGENNKNLILTYNLFKDYLVHVHLSNLHHGKKYSRPQEGILPLESLLSKMKQDGYKGDIAIKVNPEFIQAGQDQAVLTELELIRKFYDKYFTSVETVSE